MVIRILVVVNVDSNTVSVLLNTLAPVTTTTERATATIPTITTTSSLCTSIIRSAIPYFWRPSAYWNY
ncbi:hypothetical protein midi_00941 [Candidatus Midichloria mitochondrii IricVA]|uniref:Uncharacterized protein n=1 Tax=Midichloria mitochondrii (strain IricVA) TaxID=696127 RepID=F7XX23_MIDMI|nr:hypothetical protein midi_00941 [Candidatus Midichloria mitochondrii IricVA]